LDYDLQIIQAIQEKNNAVSKIESLY
jgi:hypothetical protein